MRTVLYGHWILFRHDYRILYYTIHSCLWFVGMEKMWKNKVSTRLFCYPIINDYKLLRTLSRPAPVTRMRSIMRFRTVCCSGYSGTYPNCQRKSYCTKCPYHLSDMQWQQFVLQVVSMVEHAMLLTLVTVQQAGVARTAHLVSIN